MKIKDIKGAWPKEKKPSIEFLIYMFFKMSNTEIVIDVEKLEKLLLNNQCCGRSSFLIAKKIAKACPIKVKEKK